MNILHLSGGCACAIQFVVALYALRLNRRFGIKQVGWALFGAFALLAGLQLLQSLPSVSGLPGASLEINVIYTLISFLLLTGMVHLGAVLKERNHLTQLERQFCTKLESEVKLKTAHLNRAIDELVVEMERTRAMSANIEFMDIAVFKQSIEEFHPSPLLQGSPDENSKME